MVQFSFRGKPKTDIGGGFVTPKRPVVFGPGVIVLMTLFGLTFVLYAAFFSFRINIEGETELINKEIVDLERSRNKKLEADILAFEKRVNALSQLLRSHHYTSEVFVLIEEVTLPSIFYESFGLSVTDLAAGAAAAAQPEKTFRVELKGRSPTLLDVARQMIAYVEEPRILESTVGGFGFGEGKKGVSFSASLTLDPSVVLLNTQPSRTPEKP